MSIFRLCENVPPVYPEGSRDFQLLCNLFDLVYGSTKFNIDTIPLMTDTMRCKSSLLPLLQHKLGLYLTQQIDDDALRVILKSFPYVVRKKGSKEGIREMICLYLAAFHLYSTASLIVTNENIYGGYIINVGAGTKELVNVRLLNELLSYVVPTGYQVTFSYAVTGDKTDTEVVDNDKITIYIVGDDMLSKVASIDSSYDFVIRAGTTTVAGPDIVNNLTYENFKKREIPQDEN